eukprot:scaffold21360_cov65-Phaeocystis_antarctica.AAC.7
MSALSLALRQSACQSERNGSGPQAVWLWLKRGMVELAFSHTESNPNATVCRVLLAPAARAVALVPISVHQRPLKGLLLLCAHHHVERRAADLGVVDLLDAVGALERLRLVPRLQQQHCVPDGTDAVAEQRQVGAHVGLPDHVVAHPEERVLLRQPLLLEEVSERVEQRGDRRVKEPAHKDVGLAHPLAHGQRILLFPAGDVELVDVAVFHVVLWELGLARLLVERDVGVDLLHRVARQLLQQLAHAGQRHAQPQVLGQRGQPLELRGPLGSLLFRWGHDWVRGSHLGLLLLWHRLLVGKRFRCQERYWGLLCHLALRSRDRRSMSGHLWKPHASAALIYVA